MGRVGGGASPTPAAPAVRGRLLAVALIGAACAERAGGIEPPPPTASTVAGGAGRPGASTPAAVVGGAAVDGPRVYGAAPGFPGAVVAWFAPPMFGWVVPTLGGGVWGCVPCSACPARAPRVGSAAGRAFVVAGVAGRWPPAGPWIRPPLGAVHRWPWFSGSAANPQPVASHSGTATGPRHGWPGWGPCCLRCRCRHGWAACSRGRIAGHWG